jgi:hypothetical protein
MDRANHSSIIKSLSGLFARTDKGLEIYRLYSSTIKFGG